MLTSRSNGGMLGDVPAVEQDPARRRQLEAGDHPQGRRLARSRRAEHREELAVADLEVDAVDRHDLAVALLDLRDGRRQGRTARSRAAPVVSKGIAKRGPRSWGLTADGAVVGSGQGRSQTLDVARTTYPGAAKR